MGLGVEGWGRLVRFGLGSRLGEGCIGQCLSCGGNVKW